MAARYIRARVCDDVVVTRELTDSHGRTDASLVDAAATDPSAFGELYARHVEAVYRWFRRRLDWAASDLTAETFARAWLAKGRFRDERAGSALPWLLGIAANVLADTVRRDRVETRARERLGLPLDLAADDGYAAVEERLLPRLAAGARAKRPRAAGSRRASLHAGGEAAGDPPDRRAPARVPRPSAPRAVRPQGGPVNGTILPTSLINYREALEDAVRRDLGRSPA